LINVVLQKNLYSQSP